MPVAFLGVLLLFPIPPPGGAVLYAQPAASFVPLPPPVFTIGTEGDPDYEFLGISAVLRVPAGDFAVADRSPTIRIFDPQGRMVRKLGRQGEGPGEFRSVDRLLLAGDTLIVYDGSLRRLTRYRTDGVLVGTQRVQPDVEHGLVVISARLPSGRWMVYTPYLPGWQWGHGLYRDTLRVGTLPSSSTGRVTWVGKFPGQTFFTYMPGEDKSRWAVGWAFFAPTALAVSLADTVIVGDTAIPELRYFRADGQLVRRIPIPLAAPDLSRHRALARDEELARPSTNAAYLRAAYDAPRPPSYYQSFLAAPDGAIWIRLYEEHPLGPTRYLILNSAGGIRARISLPARSRVLSLQPPWIMVQLRDADDVERVGVVRCAATLCS